MPFQWKRITTSKKKHNFVFIPNLLILLTVLLLTVILVQPVFSSKHGIQFVRKNDKPVIVDDKKVDVVSVTGYFTLKWKLTNNVNNKIENSDFLYRLEQSLTPQFTEIKTIYYGSDSASFLSGKSENNYYYRVRAESKATKAVGDWSAPYVVLVKYQSMLLAWTLFTIGALIFIAVVLVIVVGNRKSEENS